MGWTGPLFAAVEIAMREAALFAAAGFLLLGLGDLLVDLIWIGLACRRRLDGERPPNAAEILARPVSRPGWLAIYIPAWREADVIGPMLDAALRRFDHPDYRIYLGCYPNDPETIAAVRAVGDMRVRLVIGPAPGPTTKADCLNRLWEAMIEDEAAEGRRAKAVILHDAEDIVHSAELRLFDRLIEDYELVQLPVLPLIDPNSRWIAGHYADEFAEAHGKEMLVRAAISAALPAAGVGCAFEREALGRLAEAQGGKPFDPDSLTEDYELGLRMRAMGGRQRFVEIAPMGAEQRILTQEYFPSTAVAAVAQKARWMAGIALAGWDRLGWQGGVAERWMRLRDRQSVLAAILLCAGYTALLLWSLLLVRRLLLGTEPAPIGEPLATLLGINLSLLFWRLAMRFLFVSRAYGAREGLRSIPRIVVANAIAMLAARRAVVRYLSLRRTGRAEWDKTNHAFPAILPAE